MNLQIYKKGAAMTPLLIAGYAGFLLGLGLLALTFILFQKKSRLIKASLKTVGTVKRLQSVDSNVFVSGSMDDDPAFRQEENMFKGLSVAPVIEFKDKTGKTFEITGVASSPPKYNPGDHVDILYPESNPEKACIDSFFDKWLLTIVPMVFGIILFLFGMIIFII